MYEHDKIIDKVTESFRMSDVAQEFMDYLAQEIDRVGQKASDIKALYDNNVFSDLTKEEERMLTKCVKKSYEYKEALQAVYFYMVQKQNESLERLQEIIIPPIPDPHFEKKVVPNPYATGLISRIDLINLFKKR